jgi:hypothetical protein
LGVIVVQEKAALNINKLGVPFNIESIKKATFVAQGGRF